MSMVTIEDFELSLPM